MSLNDGPYTLLYNGSYSTFIFTVYQSQSIDEILLLSLLENKQTPYGNSTSGFDFQLLIRHRPVILRRRNKFYQNWTISDRVTTLCRFSKMAVIPSQTYLRFRVGLWLRLTFLKVQGCFGTKCMSNILVHG